MLFINIFSYICAVFKTKAIIKKQLNCKFMKSNEVADESYSINGFKHFSDLAVAYFPQMASTSSASKKMRNCIKASNALSEQLADAHYTDTTIEISPEMQLIIYRHWGPPHIILSVKVQRVAENKNTDKK